MKAVSLTTNGDSDSNLLENTKKANNALIGEFAMHVRAG